MNKKIFILDDEQDYISSLKSFLKEFGYTVEATAYPEYALDYIAKEKPDLVLFDFKMPDMDGDIFLKKAKEINSETKYVLVTAYKDNLIIDKFTDLGASDVILKPIDLSELLNKIQSITDKKVI